MKPPTPFQWLIGNPVVSLALMLGGLAVLYFWLTGSMTGWAALVATIIAATAARASEQVNKYSAWKREWEGYDGRQAIRLRLPSGKTMRIVAGVGCWGLFAWWASEGPKGDPVLEIAIALFWVGTAVIVVTGIVRLLRGAAPRPGAAVVVGVCLPTARQSSSVNAALGALPAHCQQLMRGEG